MADSNLFLFNQHQSFFGAGYPDPDLSYEVADFGVDVTPWDPFFQNTVGSGIEFYEDDVYDNPLDQQRLDVDFDANRDFLGEENLSFMSMGADPYLDVALPLQQRGVVGSDFLEDIEFLEENYALMVDDSRDSGIKRFAGNVLGKIASAAKGRQNARRKSGAKRPRLGEKTRPPSGTALSRERASQSRAVKTQANRNNLRRFAEGAYTSNRVPSGKAEDVKRQFQTAQKITPRAQRLSIYSTKT